MIRNILSSPKVFEAYSRIDFSYFALNQLLKNIEQSMPKTGLDIMIDDATGRSDDEFKEWATDAIKLIKGIIKDKKFLGFNTDSESKKLKELQELKKRTSTKTKKNARV